MPNKLTWLSDGLLREFSGEISPAEILKSNFEIHAHPQFESIKYIMNDFTQVTKLLVEETHTKIYSSTDDIISDTKGKLLIAMVVLDDQIPLAESYRNEMDNKLFTCEIFKTREEAQAWVDSQNSI